jgi:hypothetical protein
MIILRFFAKLAGICWRFVKRRFAFFFFSFVALVSIGGFAFFTYDYQNKRFIKKDNGEKYPIYVFGDAMYHYTMLHSLGMDGDMDIRNNHKIIGDPWGMSKVDEAKYGIPPFKYGYHKWVIGDSFLRLPFFLLGRKVAKYRYGPYRKLDGRSLTTQGFSCFASLFYAFLGLLLAYAMIKREVGRFPAMVGCAVVWFGTGLFHYSVWYSSYQHAISFFTTTLLLTSWYFWFFAPAREHSRSPGPRLTLRAIPPWYLFFLAGAAGGLNAIVRMENAPLPAIFIVPLVMQIRLLKPYRNWRVFWRFLFRWCWLPIGYVLLLSPQLGYWYWNTGHLFVNHSGDSYLRFSQPYFLELWFSPRNGILPYNPSFYLAFIGFVYLIRNNWRLLFTCFAVIGWVTLLNSSSTYYWGGYSYGVRRAVAIYAVFMLGLAGFLKLLWQLHQRYPRLILSLLTAPPLLVLIIYPQVLMVRHVGKAHFERPGKFLPQDVKGLLKRTGNPFSFPHNWYFAWKHDVPITRYEKLVSIYPMELPPVKMPKGFRKTKVLSFRDWRSQIYYTRGFRKYYQGKGKKRKLAGIRLRRATNGRVLLPIHYNRLCYRFQFQMVGQKGCRVQLSWNGGRQPIALMTKQHERLSYQPLNRQRSHGVNNIDIRSSCTLLLQSIKIIATSRGTKRGCAGP